MYDPKTGKTTLVRTCFNTHHVVLAEDPDNNVPLATGNANESLMALVDGKWINMRIPYPLGFFAKWIDGRIDDPSTGWKGRALWSTDGNRTPFHRETGKGTLPKIVKFQMRPDPLAH
jgi:hypothetical protein